MKLFGFGRKGEEPEDSELPGQESSEQEQEEQDENEGKKERGKRQKRGSGSRRSGEGATERAAANVERLAAKVEALSELRKTDSERFSRISEQIGELRNLILDKEAEIRGIGERAEKAAEMVGELQPESILSEVKKSTTKYELLEAKIEAANSLYRKVVEELKGLRKRLALFQGAEELVKLNQETSDNLANMRRIQAGIEGQANKMGNVYAQFGKQSGEIVKYRDAAAALADEFRNIKTSVEEIKAKAQTALVDQKDLDRLREDLRKELSRRVETARGASALPAGQAKSDQLVLGVLNDARQRLEKKDEEARALKDELAKSQNAIASTREELKKQARSLSSEINYLRTRLDNATAGKASAEVSGRVSKLEIGMEELKKELETYATQKRQPEQPLPAILDNLDKKLREMRQKLNQREEEARSAKGDVTKLQNSFAAIKEQLKKLEKSTPTGKEIGNIRAQLQRQSGEAAKYHNAAAALGEEFKNIKSSVEEIKAKAKAAPITQEDLDNIRADLKSELNNKVTAIRSTLWQPQARQKDTKDNRRIEEAQEMPGIEKEIVEDFKSRLEQLGRAIAGRNLHSAIMLYNQLRESYAQITKSGLPEKEKYSLRSKLLGMHKALTEAAQPQAGNQEK